YQLKQQGTLFDFGRNGGFGFLRGTTRLPAGALPVIRQNARGDAHQPGSKWHAPPFELSDAGESFPEDIGRQILRLLPVADPPRDIRIDAIKVLLVQLGKARGVALGSLDLRPFVLLLGHGQLLVNIIRSSGEKVTPPLYICSALRSHLLVFTMT